MLLFNALTGMSENSDGAAETVKKFLSAKYGQPFRVTHIGDRFNTGTATLFCQTLDGTGLSFTVVYKPLENVITDDFPVRRAAFAFDRKLSVSLSEKGITAASITLLGEADIRPDDKWSEPSDIIRSSGTKYLFSRVAVKGTSLTHQQLDDLLGIMAETDAECGGLSFVASIFLLPEERFISCSNKLSDVPRISDDEMAEFSPAAVFGATAVNGSAKITAGNVSAALKG